MATPRNSLPVDVDVQDADSSAKPRSISKEERSIASVRLVDSVESQPVGVPYKLYKRRFSGILGMFILNVVCGMTYPWFGPISNEMVEEFGISLDRTNWLGNIVACIYLPTALLVPVIVKRHGLRACCNYGALSLLLSAWIRYAGTAQSLSSGGAYALLLFGQIFAAFAQPVFQILGPKYSENWFDLQGRTTATMVIAVANPVGGALGQLLSPIVGDTRKSILVLGIISSVAAPFVFLIDSAPPIPPTYSGAQWSRSHSLSTLVKVMIGIEPTAAAHMSIRERIDFAIIILVFGPLVAATTAFSILSAQLLSPYGYSSDTAGFMGATLLLSGILAAVVTSPLSDRVFTHHLAPTIKSLVPVLAAGWLSLVWAVRRDNTAALYALMAIIGTSSVTILPLSLELAVEVTRNADASAALLWFTANLFGIIFVLVPSALRAGPDASPPLNMHRSLIFIGAFVMTTSSLIFGLKGLQTRKAVDREKQNAQIVLHQRGTPVDDTS